MKNKNFSLFSILIAFFTIFSTFSLRASFSREEQEALRDVNHSNVKTILERYKNENQEILNSSKGKDIVAVVGKTGSGKSTFINYLTHKELTVSDTGAIILNNPSDLTAMKIGVGFESETFLPKSINCENLLFYDLPGIGDTRGTAISLVNACFIKSLIENARTARLVFVIGQDEITAERGKSFKELFTITRNLIPNEIIENFSSLVITKSSPGLNNQQLIKKLEEITEPGVLTPWIQAGRLAHMSAPFGNSINQTDRDEILPVIQNTPSQKINSINIGVIYNNQDQDKIKSIYKKEIEDNFNTLIKDNIDVNNISDLDIETLDIKKNYFQNDFFNVLTSSLDNSPLITLLRPFSGEIYTSCWDEETENKQIRIRNILEQIDQNKAEKLRIQAEQERQAEEQRRIQAEREREEAELVRQAAENAQRAEEQRLIQVEKERKEREEKDFSFCLLNVKVLTPFPNPWRLQSITSNHFLYCVDKERRGSDYQVRTHLNGGEDRNFWFIIPKDGYFIIISKTTNQLLFCADNQRYKKFKKHKSDYEVRTHPYEEERNLWSIIPKDGYFIIISKTTGHSIFCADNEWHGSDHNVRTHLHNEKRNLWSIIR